MSINKELISWAKEKDPNSRVTMKIEGAKTTIRVVGTEPVGERVDVREQTLEEAYNDYFRAQKEILGRDLSR